MLTNLSGLVGLAIGTSDEGHMAGRDAVRVARLHLVKQHIGKHLANPSTAGRSVADVAFGWGFNSLSVFYRAFALAFGVPPGSVRAATVAGKGLS